MSIEDRQKIVKECFVDFFADVTAGYEWERLGRKDQEVLATYHTNHLSTINIEVQSWTKNQDHRKKKYCPKCNALLRGSRCWRCSSDLGV